MKTFTDPLAPGEKRVLTFDFSADLESAETLSGTPTITLDTLAGSDQTPSDLLNGSAAFDAENKRVLVPIKVTVNNCDYSIKVLTSTSTAEKVLALIGVLKTRT